MILLLVFNRGSIKERVKNRPYPNADPTAISQLSRPENPAVLPCLPGRPSFGTELRQSRPVEFPFLHGRYWQESIPQMPLFRQGAFSMLHPEVCFQ